MELHASQTLTPEICKKANNLYLKSSKTLVRIVISPSNLQCTIGCILMVGLAFLHFLYPDIVTSIFLYALAALLGVVLGMCLLLRMLAVPKVAIHNSFRFRDTGIDVENEICTTHYRWDSIPEIIRDDELVLLVLKLTNQYLVLDARTLLTELNELLLIKTGVPQTTP